MKICGARIFRYALPLAKPLTTKNTSEKIRTGLILELENESGQLAYSEIAPLPGLHAESLFQATAQLQEFLPTVMMVALTENDLWQISTANISLYPSVAMGVDLALLQLWAQEIGQPLYQYLNAPIRSIRLRALIDPIFDEDFVKTATAYAMQGYQTLKLKIGRMPYEKEILMVKQVREAVGPKVEICLDANRGFDLSQAIEIGKALREQKIAYIEEPLQDVRHLLEFYRATKIPIALDETWLENPLEALLEIKEAIFALVVKPGLVGGMRRLNEVLVCLKKWGIRSVMTSAFESGLGLSLWAQLAALMGDNHIAHGFGTFTWFKEDLLVPPFRAFRGQIDIAQVEKNLAAFRLQEGIFCQLVFMCKNS